MKALDLTGQKFGLLTAIERVERTASGKTRWRCRCDCGQDVIVQRDNLRSGHTRACGCRQGASGRALWTTHGMARTGPRMPEYQCWGNMKRRCLDPKNKAFKNYGARGIRICQDWLQDFHKFLADVGPRPTAQHTLDRVRNDGHYEPGNVRWATHTEQSNNTRRNRLLTHNGQTKTAAEWGHTLSIKNGTIRRRLGAGWSVHDALTRPVRHWPI
jgi:hypothetical protein